MSTLSVPPVLTSPRDDAIQLYRAFKGMGCDTATVVNILSHRDAAQRSLILHEYKSMYSEDLLKRLVSELSGKLETAVLLWMHDPAERDATVIRQAFLSDVTNIAGATEVICSRTPSQIQLIKQIYHSKFGILLEEDVAVRTSGDHQALLLAYLTTYRSEGLEVDREKAMKDAKALFKAGEKKLGTDENFYPHFQ
ncbi:Annexin 5 isoform 3 [Hibiscus syriacus]|uniref:Annexin 5 isoform 3 n=1 Tax=Hibiscus syriacus TaxID=106335 RepID=A0A6A2XI85_HIBSY|nr:Annexin 5 isoform 3 [Hibiscus syriacus]